MSYTQFRDDESRYEEIWMEEEEALSEQMKALQRVTLRAYTAADGANEDWGGYV